ncbi:MAG: GGDEF domain-containing protein [Caulobacteraceae bacterium]|nr:GGDEF domain-containing protein [Caulobacteraceae bacterium]
MTPDVNSLLRGLQAYQLGQATLAAMERDQVWPTPLNYEIWMHAVANPDGPLALEIQRLLQDDKMISEETSDRLAVEYLPNKRLHDEIREAGDQLNKELDFVTSAIKKAQQSSLDYNSTLDLADQSLGLDVESKTLRDVIKNLSTATETVRTENRSLELMLERSTSEVKRLQVHLEQVRREASTDALTALANRKSFDDAMVHHCEQADVTGNPLSFAVIDIDFFKKFNDTWGHQTGDQVIRFVASVIGRVAEPPRFAARYGGEEFCIIFPDESAAVVEEVAEAIREEISTRMLKRRSTNEDLGMITVSIGLAQRSANEPIHSLIERADAALYGSKRNGRNRVTNVGTTPLDQ